MRTRCNSELEQNSLPGARASLPAKACFSTLPAFRFRSALSMAERLFAPRAQGGQDARAPGTNARVLLKAALFGVLLFSFSPCVRADQLRLSDGTTMEVDEAWEDAQGVWYRRGGVTYLVERSSVKEVVKAGQEATKTAGSRAKGAGGANRKNANDVAVVKAADGGGAKKLEEVKKSEGVEEEVWIYL